MLDGRRWRGAQKDEINNYLFVLQRNRCKIINLAFFV
jgi:hypothetical protein